MQRPGIALVLALVVLLLIEVMTAGILTLTTQARLVAASQTRVVRAEAAAQNAVQSVLVAWESGRFDTLPVGTQVIARMGRGAQSDLTYQTTVERLLSGTYIVRAEARAGGANAFATGRAIAGARTLDGTAALEQSNGAISSGGPAVVAGATRINAAVQTLPPAWSDSVCPPTDLLPLPFTLRTASSAVVGESVTITEPPSIDSTLAIPDSIAIGGVKWSEIESIADRLEAGTVRPVSVHLDGRCDTSAAGNWGAPLAPADPCASYFPLIYVNGDLIVSGGAGQGILVVAGTVTFMTQTLFAGLIVARDGISMEPGTRIFGAVQSKTGFALLDGAQLEYSRCAIARALVNTFAADRLILQQRRFMRAY